MPKSKRDKKISLTQTNKKGLALKQQIIEDVKKCVDGYNCVFLISVQNTRNTKLLQLRSEWKDSKLVFGKLRIIALGLGCSKETEVADGIHKLANALRKYTSKGQCGLLFTNRPKSQVIEWAKEYEDIEYARAGFVSPETIKLEGPMHQFQHTMEPQLRKLGMPTSLEKGVITLIKPFTVCRKGDVLTPEQAQILAMYCWSGNISKDQDSVHNNNVPKIVVDFSSDTKQSTSSIESLEHSDNESTRRRKYMQKLQYEIKTRWPSATSIKD